MNETMPNELSVEVRKILDKVRELSPADRARLVSGILESPDEPDPAVDQQWREEVERRVDGMDDATRPATPWNEARKALGL